MNNLNRDIPVPDTNEDLDTNIVRLFELNQSQVTTIFDMGKRIDEIMHKDKKKALDPEQLNNCIMVIK